MMPFRDVASFGLGVMAPLPPFFFKVFYIYIYIYILILVILIYKITFFFLNNIIVSFKSNAILTNFFITFLQTILVTNSYWFLHGLTIYIIFLLTSNHLLYP